MTVILALLGALAGGLLGMIAGFFLVVGLGTVLGADDQQGALAMGAAMSGAPVGAVIGAVLGCALVIRARRGAGDDQGKPGIPRQGWIALALVGAVLGGLYLYLFHEPRPPMLSSAAKVVLHTEIRVPLEETDLENFDYFRPDLRTYNDLYFSPDRVTGPVVDGAEVVWYAQHRLAYDHADRSVQLWVRPRLLLIFDLDLPGNPPQQDMFSDWRAPTHVREETLGPDLPAGDGFRFRMRVTRETR